MFKVINVPKYISYEVNCPNCYALLKSENSEDLGSIDSDGYYRIYCKNCEKTIKVSPDSINTIAIY